MSRFQIFIPGSEVLTADQLAGVGLSDLITNAAVQKSDGPGGVGALVSWPVAGDAITGYKPGEQKWLPAVKSGELEAGRYWVGVWNNKPPTPKDLQRQYRYNGKPVRLNDGNEWLIPRATALPTEMILADSGEWKFEVQRQFHDFWIEAERWQQRLIENKNEGDSFSWADISAYIVQALKLNYMLTDELISELRIFSQDNLFKALFVVCEVVTDGRK